MIKSKSLITKGRFYKDPKFWILIGLIVLIGIAISASWRTTAVPVQRVKIPTTQHPIASKGTDSKQTFAEAPDPKVLIAKLKQQQEEYEGGNRNLFVFFTPPPPPPKMAEKKEMAEPPPPVCGDGRCEGGENYQTCASDCPPPPPPEIALKFIGYLLDKNQAVAFLTDGNEVFMGRENDIIANKYRILKITAEGVELGYLNLNTKQSRTIPYQGNNKS